MGIQWTDRFILFIVSDRFLKTAPTHSRDLFPNHDIVGLLNGAAHEAGARAEGAERAPAHARGRRRGHVVRGQEVEAEVASGHGCRAREHGGHETAPDGADARVEHLCHAREKSLVFVYRSLGDAAFVVKDCRDAG